VVLGVPELAERILAAVAAVGFEVGGGGAEEQQVDFQVEQVGHGEEHRLLYPALLSASPRRSVTRLAWSSFIVGSLGMTASSRSHSAADSLLIVRPPG
jgi:hypothetical protein